MYFDFDDSRPDTPRVATAISWREGVLLSIIVHLLTVITLILSPELFAVDEAARARAIALAEQRVKDNAQFVFVQPRLDTEAPKPPDRADASDKDRIARAPEQAPKPANESPFSRGNTPERVEEEPTPAARGEGPTPDPAAGEQAQNTPPPPPESQSAMQLPTPPPPNTTNGADGRAAAAGGSLGDALRNLQRYVQQYDNTAGGGGQYGPEIQFDSKGVEFGPWIRRFVAQVKRNWYVPYITSSGHVVITFNVHRNGALTDLTIVGPCPIDAFNNASFGALASSNPTQPLPAGYPADKAFFTVTFFYNESPP
jgi:outer membrane biosynthesis protein TonB